jgi:hypothetical protein
MKAKSSWVFCSAVALVMFARTSASGFYDPGLQRWINRDPIAEQGGINLFAFAGNNSITKADKYGECPLLAIPLLWLAEGATALTATEVGILGGTAFGVGATAVAVNTPIGMNPEAGVEYKPHPTIQNGPPASITFALPIPVGPTVVPTQGPGRGNPGERGQQRESPNRPKTDGKPDNQTGQRPDPLPPEEPPKTPPLRKYDKQDDWWNRSPWDKSPPKDLCPPRPGT